MGAHPSGALALAPRHGVTAPPRRAAPLPLPPQDVENVGLWLGAGVMCEYPLDEARSLLAANKAQCEGSLEQQQENLGLLKDAITITEVNTARVFNWDVERRRAQKAG